MQSAIYEDAIDDIENNFKYCKYHLAMSGKSWALAKEYFPELIPKLVTKGTVFARMSGEQKQQLILEIQALGYYVGKLQLIFSV